MTIFKEHTETIPGNVGDIEIRYHDGEYDKPIAVVCHPHPLYGGSMDNKVVHTLIKAFASLGLSTLRFNFRGVGQSSGDYDKGRGESDDLLTVCQWLRQRHPQRPLWLAGFSFGAYVALASHQKVKAAQLCLVAPPVTLYDFNKLPGVNIPWMVIQGGKDEIIDPDAVAEWLESLSPQPYVAWFREAGHFFHGGLKKLTEVVTRASRRVLD